MKSWEQTLGDFLKNSSEKPIVLDPFLDEDGTATLKIDYQGLISSLFQIQEDYSELAWLDYQLLHRGGSRFPAGQFVRKRNVNAFFRKLNKNQVIGLEIFRNTKLLFPEISQCYWCLQQIIVIWLKKGFSSSKIPILASSEYTRSIFLRRYSSILEWYWEIYPLETARYHLDWTDG